MWWGAFLICLKCPNTIFFIANSSYWTPPDNGYQPMFGRHPISIPGHWFHCIPKLYATARKQMCFHFQMIDKLQMRMCLFVSVIIYWTDKCACTYFILSRMCDVFVNSSYLCSGVNISCWYLLALLIEPVSYFFIACVSGTVVAGQLWDSWRRESATFHTLLPLSAALPGAETRAC